MPYSRVLPRLLALATLIMLQSPRPSCRRGTTLAQKVALSPGNRRGGGGGGVAGGGPIGLVCFGSGTVTCVRAPPHSFLRVARVLVTADSELTTGTRAGSSRLGVDHRHTGRVRETRLSSRRGVSVEESARGRRLRRRGGGEAGVSGPECETHITIPLPAGPWLRPGRPRLPLRAGRERQVRHPWQGPGRRRVAIVARAVRACSRNVVLWMCGGFCVNGVAGRWGEREGG